VHQLQTQGVNAQWFSKSHVEAFENALPFADAAIFYRVPATPQIVDVIRYARSIGKLTFYDIDDLIFDSEHYPEPFEAYANLISWQQYSGLVAGSELFRLAMRECDYGIASTVPLADRVAREVLTGDSIVVANSLGESHRVAQLNSVRLPDRNVRLFYGSGTLAHKQDFADFARLVLVPLLAKHSRLLLTLVGTFPDLPILDHFRSRIERYPPTWDFERFLGYLSKADINIAVLSPGTFNDCKSEIKWMEAAIFGIPSVLSRTRTHELTTEHGKTALLCGSNEEWLDALDQLIGDGNLRRSIGSAAKDVVMAQYGPETIGAKFVKAIESRIVRAVGPRRLRIAVVHVFYPPQAIGGATRVVHETVESLHARYSAEIEVGVFTTIDDGRPGEVREYLHNGVRVTAASPKSEPGFELRPKDEDIEKVFVRFLGYFEPDIVHFHCVQRLTGSVVEATRRAGIPYFVTVHDGWWLSDHQFLVDERGQVHMGGALTIDAMKHAGVASESIVRTVYLRSLLEAAEGVLAVSAQFGEIYESVGIGNVRVVENGTTVLNPVARKSDTNRLVRVGFIGGLSKHKGYHLVRNVWNSTRFQNLELVLVDHSQSEFTRWRTKWNGNTVLFIGRVHQSRISELYASLDVLLAPSIWPESYGLVTREAAQAGLWIVASDRGSIGDVVREGQNGFKVDVSDAKNLERIMRAIDDSPEKYSGRTNYAVPIRSFDEQVDELVQIYRSVAFSKTQCGLRPTQAAQRNPSHQDRRHPNGS
jgi:glycosyltransferase involved in cell wall biosynthesis